MRLALVRGDHRLNEIKLQNALGSPFRPATEEEIAQPSAREPGFIGPVGSRRRGDRRRMRSSRASTSPGANSDGLSPARRASPGATSAPPSPTSARSRRGTAVRSAARSGSSPRSRSATSSSSAPATRSRSARPTSTRTASERPIVMGSYGIGPARIAAAADRAGSRRARHLLAARDRALRRAPGGARQAGHAGARAGGAPVRRAGRGGLRRPLRRPRRQARGRSSWRRSCSDARCGSSPASAASRAASSRCRCGAERRSAAVPLEGAAERAARAVEGLRTRPQARPARACGAGGPSRPRRAPASRFGRSRCRTSSASCASGCWSPSSRSRFPPTTAACAIATACFMAAAAADYLDGMLARLTGQYSRLGALMDPLSTVP